MNDFNALYFHTDFSLINRLQSGYQTPYSNRGDYNRYPNLLQPTMSPHPTDTDTEDDKTTSAENGDASPPKEDITSKNESNIVAPNANNEVGAKRRKPLKTNKVTQQIQVRFQSEILVLSSNLSLIECKIKLDTLKMCFQIILDTRGDGRGRHA